MPYRDEEAARAYQREYRRAQRAAARAAQDVQPGSDDEYEEDVMPTLESNVIAVIPERVELVARYIVTHGGFDHGDSRRVGRDAVRLVRSDGTVRTEIAIYFSTGLIAAWGPEADTALAQEAQGMPLEQLQADVAETRRQWAGVLPGGVAW